MTVFETVGLTVDERERLRSSARSFLEAKAPTSELREFLATGDGDPRGQLWKRISKLGWAAIEVPDHYDGESGRFADLAVVLEELGRLMTPVPFMSTTVLGVGALLQADPELQRRWLPRIAEGKAVVTAALGGQQGEPGDIDVSATPTGGSWSLSGTSAFVPDADSADAIAVAARHSDAPGLSMFLIATDVPGLTIERQATVDATRRLSKVTLSDVQVTQGDSLTPVSEGLVLRDELIDRAALALACDAAGGAERVLNLTLEHLRTREQFGRPVGSFQALKHRSANLHLRVESARTAARHAAAAAEDPGRRSGAASIAKSVACDAYAFVAAEAIQLHGGVGYTAEYDPQLHLKRARLSAALFGDSAWHRDRLARLALGG